MSWSPRSRGPAPAWIAVVGTERTFALLRSELDVVHRIARSHGATINDVLLTATAAGVGALLESRGEPVTKLDLPIYVPVSLRRGGFVEGRGNLISQMVIRLPVGPQDPAVRLEMVASRTVQAKALARSSLGATFRGMILSAVMLRLVIRQRVNLCSADLPGPQQPLNFEGARVLEVFPLMNLIGNVTLAAGAMSYAGQLDVMVVADGAAYPDLGVFAAAARHELQSLTEATGPNRDAQPPRTSGTAATPALTAS